MMTFTTYTGVQIPSFMYGTAWKKDATAVLVRAAVAAGFAAIDTANQIIHYNEAAVGEALAQLAREEISRDSLFLQTKFTPLPGQGGRAPYDPDADLTTQVQQSFASSLEHLGVDRVDSYVLHGPYTRGGLTGADWEVWAAIESIHAAGQARVIGVSNVDARQLQLLCERATVKPMVVQNRCFAALGWDRDTRALCREHGIVYQGFSLLTANPHALFDPVVNDAARAHGVGPAQVVFRFAQQVGMLPLTGTTNEAHMHDDLRVGDFELPVEVIAHIETLATPGS